MSSAASIYLLELNSSTYPQDKETGSSFRNCIVNSWYYRRICLFDLSPLCGGCPNLIHIKEGWNFLPLHWLPKTQPRDFQQAVSLTPCRQPIQSTFPCCSILQDPPQVGLSPNKSPNLRYAIDSFLLVLRLLQNLSHALWIDKFSSNTLGPHESNFWTYPRPVCPCSHWWHTSGLEDLSRPHWPPHSCKRNSPSALSVCQVQKVLILNGPNLFHWTYEIWWRGF